MVRQGMVRGAAPARVSGRNRRQANHNAQVPSLINSIGRLASAPAIDQHDQQAPVQRVVAAGKAAWLGATDQQLNKLALPE